MSRKLAILRCSHNFGAKELKSAIIEAFIAVLIVLSAVLILMSKQKVEIVKSEEIISLQKQILDYVKVDEALRSEILNKDSSGVENLIQKSIPLWINYSINICDATLVCPNPAGILTKQVYANELLITSNRTYYPGNATRMVLFFWEK